MLGLLRLLLAYFVVVSHLVGGDYFAHFGFYAVRGFFVISGFLMTSALNDVYKFDGVRFWSNRALRLLPPYFLVSGITLIVIALLPSEAGEFLKFWHGSPQLHDVLLNLSIIPLQFTESTFRLVPPFWSVAVEIDMYLLLYLIVARSAGWALVALFAGLSYHLACISIGASWGAYYFTAPGAVLPFSVGALLYFFRKCEIWIITPRAAAIAFVAWFMNLLAGGWVFADTYIFGLGYYFDTILITIVVGGFAWRGFHPVIQRLDKTLGEWAYFVFLVQWLAAFAVARIFHLSQPRGWVVLLAAVPLTAVASAGLALLNRMFVEPMRQQVRELRIATVPVLSSEQKV